MANLLAVDDFSVVYSKLQAAGYNEVRGYFVVVCRYCFVEIDFWSIEGYRCTVQSSNVMFATLLFFAFDFYDFPPLTLTFLQILFHSFLHLIHPCRFSALRRNYCYNFLSIFASICRFRDKYFYRPRAGRNLARYRLVNLL